ncbi:MAG TPA: hypothetical protein VGK27_00020 [Candidatus Deferrimicrobiaceae bacterium]|jgi:hypothetical protein
MRNFPKIKILLLLLLTLVSAAVVANQALTHTHSGLSYYEDNRSDDDYSQEFGGGEYASAPPTSIDLQSEVITYDFQRTNLEIVPVFSPHHQILRV